MEKEILEDLYMTPEMEAIYQRGRRDEQKQHKCPKPEVVIKIKEKKVARKPHPRSREKKWGVVNKGQLLNPTFDSQKEATDFIIHGLVPANPAVRARVTIDAIVIKLH